MNSGNSDRWAMALRFGSKVKEDLICGVGTGLVRPCESSISSHSSRERHLGSFSHDTKYDT